MNKQQNDKKFTQLEKYWMLYDVANSAFILMVSTLIPIYFNYLAEEANLSSVQYLAYWGYATSISTLVVAFLGPVLGAIADTKNFKKKLLFVSVLIGSVSCALLGTVSTWVVFLILYAVAKFGYSASLIFNDAMLTDITTEDRLDVVSSHGFAWGYVGSCIPFVIGLALVLGGGAIGLSMPLAMMITFIMIGAWWFFLTLPLLSKYKQTHYVETKDHIISNSFKRIFQTLKEVRKEKQIFMFLLAFFFYIDGVHTIISMATAYGEALGLDSNGLLMALLVTQLVAFPATVAFAKLSRRFEGKNLITVCIIGYIGIAIFGYFLQTQLQFWILAICVGLFQGGIQALSRSYFAKIIPYEKAGEYFGIYDICGKGAAFLGTSLMSVMSQLTGNINVGVGAIAILFVIGLILFRKAINLEPAEKRNA